MGKRSRNKRRENQPCWCGSGKKYRDCHLNRENEPSPTLQEAASFLKKVASKEYCLYPTSGKPNCSPQIAKSHTVQENGSLSRIARKGHVYGIKHGVKVLDVDGLPRLELIGLSSASTFTGFCKYHDNLIFAPIEKNPFQSNAEHTFLLGYRAISREYFYKRAQFELIPFSLSLDRGRNLQEQIAYQDFYQTFNTGVILGFNDLKYHKARYDEVLLSSNFSSVKYYVIRFQNVPDVMCSGSMALEYDFNGNILQQLVSANVSEQISFSLIVTDRGGAAVLNWLGDNPVCLNFVKSLHEISDTDVSHAVLRFCLDSFENVYFSPSWWEALSNEQQRAIRQRVAYLTNPIEDINRFSLKDDGVRVIEWKVSARETNCVLGE